MVISICLRVLSQARDLLNLVRILQVELDIVRDGPQPEPQKKLNRDGF